VEGAAAAVDKAVDAKALGGARLRLAAVVVAVAVAVPVAVAVALPPSLLLARLAALVVVLVRVLVVVAVAVVVLVVVAVRLVLLLTRGALLLRLLLQRRLQFGVCVGGEDRSTAGPQDCLPCTVHHPDAHAPAAAFAFFQLRSPQNG